MTIERDGFLGALDALSEALLSSDETKDALIKEAREIILKTARQSVSSLEIGLELGKDLATQVATTGIPSFNRQDVKESDYPAVEYRQIDWSKIDHSKLPYVCDCCRVHVSPQGAGMGADYWVPKWNPRLVGVAGVIYYGCSAACARILFDVHHRYAQLMVAR